MRLLGLLILCVNFTSAAGVREPVLAVALDQVTERYCIADEDVASVILAGQVTYTNTGSVAFWVLANFGDEQQIRIETTGNGLAGKHWTQSPFSVRDSTKRYSKNDLVFLKPNARFTTPVTVQFFARRTQADPGESSLADLPGNGEYRVAVCFSWPDVLPGVDPLAGNLLADEVVWKRSVWSNSIPVRIDPTVNCGPKAIQAPAE